jgi:protocatechuate 3,4-dioxygenase beta subunit
VRAVWIQFVAAWLAAGVSSLAQAPPSPFAAVSGVVLNDATGEPIRRAQVRLSTADAPQLEAVTYSESNGAFGFNTIPPGKYRLFAQKDGFQGQWFGANTPSRPPGTLVLSASAARYGITFRLRPMGSIAGSVFDQDGDPLADMSLRLLKAAFERRKPAWRDAGWASSDDHGHYRFTGVAPGRYLVMAANQHRPALVAHPEGVTGNGLMQQVYAAQFFSGATQVSSATPVEVLPGKEVAEIDFHLAPRPVTTLQGKIVLPSGFSVEGLPANTVVQIIVYPQDVDNNGAQSAGGMAAGPNFEFQVPNLTAGPYLVVANLSTDGRDYRAAERVELPLTQEMALRLEPSIDLAGRLDVEGNGPPPSAFHVTLLSGDLPPIRMQPRADVQPDGSFVIHNVVPGIWDIDAEPVPPGGYIKAMRLGDQDVLTEEMILTSATRDQLRVVMSTRGAVVAGQVKVPHDVPRSARAAVLLAPAGKFENVWSFFATAAADDTGHFEFKGVTPGRYRLYAFDELEFGEWDDPAFLKAFEPLSEVFDVAEGARTEREIPLIPRS